jgi:hypothetical protein
MFTYFLAALPDELIAFQTEKDVLDHIEKRRPTVGGRFSRERIDFLSTVFLHEERQSMPTGQKLIDGAEFFQVDSDLRRAIGKAEHKQLIDASAPWDEGAWQNTEVNRMDLAGFLLEFGELCSSATIANENVYFVTIEID